MKMIRAIAFRCSNAPIKRGEYHAAFRPGMKPINAIKRALFIGKHMMPTSRSTGMFIYYVGKLPKRSRATIDHLQHIGLIYDVQESCFRNGKWTREGREREQEQERELAEVR